MGTPCSEDYGRAEIEMIKQRQGGLSQGNSKCKGPEIQTTVTPRGEVDGNVGATSHQRGSA